MQQAILDFITNYGLPGFMSALPTTPLCKDYEAVYLPNNHIVKEESMTTDEYPAHIFPFGNLDFYKIRNGAVCVSDHV